jgi:hypothetical protein
VVGDRKKSEKPKSSCEWNKKRRKEKPKEEGFLWSQEKKKREKVKFMILKREFQEEPATGPDTLKGMKVRTTFYPFFASLAFDLRRVNVVTKSEE